MCQGGDGFQDDGGQRRRRFLRRPAGRLVRSHNPEICLYACAMSESDHYGNALSSAGRFSGQRCDGRHAGSWSTPSAQADGPLAMPNYAYDPANPYQPRPALQRDFLQRPFGVTGQTGKIYSFENRSNGGKDAAVQLEEPGDELPHQEVRSSMGSTGPDLGQQDSRTRKFFIRCPHGAVLSPSKESQSGSAAPMPRSTVRFQPASVIAYPRSRMTYDGAEGISVDPHLGAGFAGWQARDLDKFPQQRAPHETRFSRAIWFLTCDAGRRRSVKGTHGRNGAGYAPTERDFV